MARCSRKAIYMMSFRKQLSSWTRDKRRSNPESSCVSLAPRTFTTANLTSFILESRLMICRHVSYRNIYLQLTRSSGRRIGQTRQTLLGISYYLGISPSTYGSCCPPSKRQWTINIWSDHGQLAFHALYLCC